MQTSAGSAKLSSGRTPHLGLARTRTRIGLRLRPHKPRGTLDFAASVGPEARKNIRARTASQEIPPRIRYSM
jgi:hypothetical protein